jgi:hypothetical protein
MLSGSGTLDGSKLWVNSLNCESGAEPDSISLKM